MISAYILIDVKKGHTVKVVELLKQVDEIELLSVVTGEYDIIIRIKVQELDELFDIMVNKIDSIEGVNETVTSIVEKDFK
ncbi:MAG: Lrp/AsnC ligand binding domain-containing protein [Candidatus Heimdallarchaeota archaeon]|nr:Lrp/AsnC ligand binding domain-containing protein [Candidatus Heimdallarchaeota archaeon]